MKRTRTRPVGGAAFERLERACGQRDPGLTEVRCSPLLRSLRGDPRWGDLTRRSGLEG